MENEEAAEIGDIQELFDDEDFQAAESEIGDVQESFSDDDFHLDVSLAILDSESEQVDDAFVEAVTEIEGKKSFPCSKCIKVCRSKGGLTKHMNSKHRDVEAASKSTTELDTTAEDRFSYENLAGIVEAIKVSLLAGDLYGSAINTAIKNASCNKALFDALLPLYNRFCKKKNQDELLEQFYGLTPNATKYLNCADLRAANIVMIEIPDRLVGFFKVSEERSKVKSTGSTAVELKLEPSERGPLSYIAGYIVSKLQQKARDKKGCAEDLQALLQSLKSTEMGNFILARSRGGLVSPSHHLMGIVEETEICFRKNVGNCELVLRNIPTEMICESALSSPVVKSLWGNIVLESGIEESSSTQKLCLENIVKLYVRVRSFSYAKDYISKYKIREKQSKSKSLRKELKRHKNN